MRFRLLPILMFALAGTMTVKIGAVWDAIEVSVGRESLAQAQPAAEAAAETQSDPAAATQAEPAMALEAAAPSPPEPATGPAAPDASLAGRPISDDALVDTADEKPVADPFDFTDEEVDVLQQLAKRREELDLRARQLDERETLIQAAEQRMEQKMAELRALQAMVEDLLRVRGEQEEAELKSLVKVYENMKPKAAARVFEVMDMDVLLDVVDRMNERKIAPILALVTPTRAKEITFELAQRRQLPVPE
jgi:flagellar motility protein MotE (MotC chaperone)